LFFEILIFEIKKISKKFFKINFQKSKEENKNAGA